VSEENIVRARRLPDGTLVQVFPDGSTQPLKGRTDWARLAAMTEEEIEANALSDPDNPPATEEQLKFMRRWVNVPELRRRQGLTQEQFSDRYRIPLGTLRDWEQRRREPDGTAKTLLRIIDKYPEIVLEVLAAEFGHSTISPEPGADSAPAPGPARRHGRRRS
jgi:putative transcriptional regulator